MNGIFSILSRKSHLLEVNFKFCLKWNRQFGHSYINSVI